MLLYPLLLLFGVFAIVLLAFKLPTIKGNLGEYFVHRSLLRLPDEYHVLDNVILPNAGSTTQIDHIVISPYGIFVIETKNYKGWVYGGEYSEYWTQNIYGQKYDLYNPFKQNDGHVRALQRLLPELPKDVFIPIVCFTDRTQLFVKAKNHLLVQRSYLQDTIRDFSEPRLTEELRWAVIQKINACTLVGDEAERLHKQNVKTSLYYKEASEHTATCPRCGGKLVLRKGRFGSFYGCSRYPECTYTQN